MSLIQNLAANQYTQKPQHVVGNIICNGTSIGENRQQLESKRFISLEYFGEALDLIKKAEESENFAG